MLDVVYNHLGNEGNYLRMFGPYFTGAHKTPGRAITMTPAGSEGVREFVDREREVLDPGNTHGRAALDAVQTIP